MLDTFLSQYSIPQKCDCSACSLLLRNADQDCSTIASLCFFLQGVGQACA